jgi:hypothetical protein
VQAFEHLLRKILGLLQSPQGEKAEGNPNERDGCVDQLVVRQEIDRQRNTEDK